MSDKNYSDSVYKDYSHYNIAELFKNIENDLMSNMSRNLAGHRQDEKAEGFKWTQWQAEKAKSLNKFIKENKKILGGYESNISDSIKKEMEEQFKEGASIVDKEIQKAVKGGYITQSDASGDFFKVNEGKVKSLINSVQVDIDNAMTATLRKTNDVYRKVIFDAEMYAASGTKTVKQCIDMATKDFYKRGITCIKYKNGAIVDVKKYAAMAIRTANKRAFLVGEGLRRDEWGEYLVIMSKYGQCSLTCLPYQGKVYIDDVYSHPTAEQKQKYISKGYTLLSKAIEGGAFHPNCKHTLSTFFEGISKLPEEEKIDMEQSEGMTAEQKKVSICNREAEGWERVLKYSLDKESKKVALKKAKLCRIKAKNIENNIAKSAKNDIMKAGSRNTVLEYQRYGRNKNTVINNSYIDSGEYRNKFDKITNNKDINRILYVKSKEMLKHRSGTLIEDMYWIDGDTGKVVASVLNETKIKGISYSKEVLNAIFGKSNLITLHTHPNSMPPSVADFNSAVRNNYREGLVICHDGKVFCYIANEEVNEELYLLYIKKYMDEGNTEYMAQLKALYKLKGNHDIDFWEVD